MQTYYIHPYSTPTRAALLSGRYAHNVGLNSDLTIASPFGLGLNTRTMGDVFQQAGYYTAFLGTVRRTGSSLLARVRHGSHSSLSLPPPHTRTFSRTQRPAAGNSGTWAAPRRRIPPCATATTSLSAR